MFSVSSDAAYLSPDIQLEIWHWAIDTIGMPITVIFLIVVLVLSCLIGRKVCRRVSNSPQIKGDNNIVGNKIHNTYFIPPSKDNNEQQADTTPLSKREWLLLTSLADGYERAAGFRAAGAIYHTAGAWPRYFIMQASPRVYTATEEHYDKDGEMQYILLEQDSPNSEPYKVRVSGNDSEQQAMLKSLYGLAQARSSAGKECSVRI